MRLASFFSGLGGFDLAFEQAGYEIAFQCEIDPFCQAVLCKHWPHVPKIPDIADVNANEIPDADVWCAGFPCQDLSLANQGKRRGLHGNRSGLFFRFADLLGAATPKWVVLENVVGLLNSGSGEDFRVVLSTLDELGYCLAWRVLDSKYFGTPQRRRRTYIVGSYKFFGAARVLFGCGSIAEVAAPSRLPGAHAPSRFAAGGTEADLYVLQHATIGRAPTAGPQAKGFRCDGETYTLDSRGSSDVVCAPHAGFGVRTTSGLSRELDGRRFRALGNAVTVPVARWIAERIRRVDEEEAGKVVDNSGCPGC